MVPFCLPFVTVIHAANEVTKFTVKREFTFINFFEKYGLLAALERSDTAYSANNYPYSLIAKNQVFWFESWYQHFFPLCTWKTQA